MKNRPLMLINLILFVSILMLSSCKETTENITTCQPTKVNCLQNNNCNVLPKSSFKFVVFDFGGVVADVDTTEFKKFLMSSFNITKKVLRQALTKMRSYKESEQEFWEEYATSKNIILPKNWIDRYETILKNTIIINSETIEIVKILQKRGYKTPMLSDVTLGQAKVVKRLGYYDLFDPVLLSCEIGAKKPFPEAFQILLKTLNSPASQILFIDDRIKNVEGAKKEGIDSIQFTSANQLKEELEKRGFGLFPSSVNTKIKDAKIGFQNRWEKYFENKNFHMWKEGLSEKEIKNRFEQMQKERWTVYFTNPEDFGKQGILGKWNEDFKMPENFSSFHSRYKHPVSTLYNLASLNYNANIVILNDMRFLAMEGPIKQNLNIFFQLLRDYNATDLVRLTPKIYQGLDASFPYWDGITNISSISGHPTIEINSRELNYFPTDCWKDWEGVETKKLLALVKAVRNSPIASTKIIAVHCRAGVGRTGTFIVAYILLNEIDRQIKEGRPLDQLQISIDKTIWQMALQRPFAVPHFPQYLTLHQLLDYYIKENYVSKTKN